MNYIKVSLNIPTTDAEKQEQLASACKHSLLDTQTLDANLRAGLASIDGPLVLWWIAADCKNHDALDLELLHLSRSELEVAYEKFLQPVVAQELQQHPCAVHPAHPLEPAAPS